MHSYSTQWYILLFYQILYWYFKNSRNYKQKRVLENILLRKTLRNVKMKKCRENLKIGFLAPDSSYLVFKFERDTLSIKRAISV